MTYLPRQRPAEMRSDGRWQGPGRAYGVDQIQGRKARHRQRPPGKPSAREWLAPGGVGLGLSLQSLPPLLSHPAGPRAESATNPHSLAMNAQIFFRIIDGNQRSNIIHDTSRPCSFQIPTFQTMSGMCCRPVDHAICFQGLGSLAHAVLRAKVQPACNLLCGNEKAVLTVQSGCT